MQDERRMLHAVYRVGELFMQAGRINKHVPIIPAFTI